MSSTLWLPLAVLSYAIFAVTGVIDKIVITKKIKNALMVSFWVSLAGTGSGVLLLLGFLPSPYSEIFAPHLPPFDIVVLLAIGGILLQLGLLLYYVALKSGEATRVQSSIGAAMPIFALIFAYGILHERLSGLTLAAFLLLVVGGSIMLFRRGHWLGSAFVLAVAAAAFMAIQTVIAKIAYEHNHFITCLVLFGLGNVIYCLILLVISPSVRRGLRALTTRRPSKMKRVERSGSAIILINSFLGGLGVVCLNLAIKFGTVSLVNGLKGLQYAGVFVITLGMSRFMPRLLKEELSGQTMRQKIVAIVIITAGLGLLTVAV